MKFLLDSNIIIYLNTERRNQLLPILQRLPFSLSWISYVEVMGFAGLSEADQEIYERFFANAPVLPVSEPIMREAARLRRQKKLTLGDSIIAATAVVHQLTLVTANTRDFKKFPQLTLLNPFEG